jgi:protocatechuate 4,5-dioxygenase alpha chain
LILINDRRGLARFPDDDETEQTCARLAMTNSQQIPGTTIFNGTEAEKGLALNKMCFSFNSADNRAEFLRDQDAYCSKFGLTAEQKAAVKARDVLAMIAAGGNVYYLAKLAGIFGLNVQDIGAQQTGMSVEAFKAKLKEARR